MTNKTLRQWLALFAAFVGLTSVSMGQGGSAGNSTGKPSKPQPDYPIVHIPKWQVDYRFTASEGYTVKMGDAQMIHKPSWNISGMAIVDSNGSDGKPIPIDPHAESNEWQARGNGGGSFSGEFYGEPSLGYRQIYAGGGKVSPSDHSAVSLKIDAAAGQYEISFSMELYGNVAMDASDLKKRVEAIKGQAKSDDVIGKELMEFLEGIGNAAEKEGTKKFRQTISCDSFKMPLPSLGQGGSPVLSGSKKVQNYVHEIVVGTLEGNFTWEIRPYDEAKNVNVTLSGCSEVGVGQQGAVTAKGRPGGGSYRFWAEPLDAIRVAAQGAIATVMGGEPGKGTLYVEYTSLEGKLANASQPAASVAIESINGRTAIPKIGLYDVDGKRTEAILTVPVSVKPQSAGDMIIYKPADPAVLTAVSQGDTILLQGLREGKTTFQGTTKCGGTLGPVVSVQVVPCDDEVKARIAEEEKIAMEAIQEQLKADGEIRNEKEFTDLNIGKSTGSLLAKLGSVIIGSLSAGSGASHSVERLAGIISAGTRIEGVLEGGNPETAAIMTQLQVLGIEVPNLIAETVELHEAAEKFGEDLGFLEGTAEKLENIRNWIDHWVRMIEDIARRKKLCKEQTQEPKRKTDPQPTKKDPTSTRTPKPTPQEPPTPTEPVPGDGDTGTGEPPSPPPPTTSVGTRGLPYSNEPGKCGCSKTAGPGQISASTDSSGIADIHSGVENLKQCTDQFNKFALADFTFTLDDWKTLLHDIETATKAGKAELAAASKGLGTRLNAVIGKTKEFDQTGHQFYSGFENCPAAVDSAVGVLKAAPDMGKK
jgi:hypothetical protein